MLLIGIHVMDLLQDVPHPRMEDFAASPSSITGDEFHIAALQEMQLEIHDELHVVRCLCLPVVQLAKQHRMLAARYGRWQARLTPFAKQAEHTGYFFFSKCLPFAMCSQNAKLQLFAATA